MVLLHCRLVFEGEFMKVKTLRISAEEELFASGSEFNTIFEELNKKRTDIW
jgi:hypothetical protein